jgi:two-component system sensor histidine kinase PilS (NtrC family)
VFIYHRHHADIDVPSSWIVGTRAAALAVTAVIAWPMLAVVPVLRASVVVYAAATVAVILFQLLARRSARRLLGIVLRGAHVTSELAVISQIVLHSGGLHSPSIFLYLMTIIASAVSYRLVGTLLVASASSIAYITVIWLRTTQSVVLLQPSELLGTVRRLSDEDFFSVFAHLCIFFLCAFVGGFLAERLWSKDRVLAHATKALEVAKLETGDILKHLQSGILTIDMACRVVYFNRAAEAILGIPGRGARGRPLREVLGEQYPDLVDRLETVLSSRKMDVRTELSLRRADGQNIPIGISTSFLGGAGDKPRGLISIFQDLTHAKLIEERMRAQDRLAAIGELSAAIAHEIRNPLAAISGSVEVLRHELDVSGENRKLLDLIIKESGRLNKILTDFLMYARIRPTVSGRVCVASTLDEVFEIATRHFDGLDGWRLTSGIEERSLAVRADADHLKQMMINLVFNAIESLDGADGEVNVSVSLLDDERAAGIPALGGSPSDWVVITVTDTGIGIPDSVLARLFEPFVSSKPSGTGLGLAIVARLAESTGGHVTFENRIGGGTAFSLILPRCHAQSTDARAGANATSPTRAPAV